MANYNFTGDNHVGGTLASIAGSTLNALVRIAGLALLAVGLWTAIAIIQEAWALYNRPDSPRVEAIARAIEQASHLDRALTPKRVKPAPAGQAPEGGEAASDGEQNADAAAGPEPAAEDPPVRFTYFIAWVILLMLLLLIGRLAIAAIKTGGELALYDVEVRRFAREIARELSRHGSRG